MRLAMPRREVKLGHDCQDGPFYLGQLGEVVGNHRF
jgi:hypothetical protein